MTLQRQMQRMGLNLTYARSSGVYVSESARYRCHDMSLYLYLWLICATYVLSICRGFVHMSRGIRLAAMTPCNHPGGVAIAAPSGGFGKGEIGDITDRLSCFMKQKRKKGGRL